MSEREFVEKYLLARAGAITGDIDASKVFEVGRTLYYKLTRLSTTPK